MLVLGAQLVIYDRSIAIVLIVTFLIYRADEVFSRLLPKGLIDLGLPGEPDPFLWLTGLGLVTLYTGASFCGSFRTNYQANRHFVFYTKRVTEFMSIY